MQMFGQYTEQFISGQRSPHTRQSIFGWTYSTAQLIVNCPLSWHAFTGVPAERGGEQGEGAAQEV